MNSKLLVVLLVLASLVAGYFLGRMHARYTVDNYLAEMSVPEVRRALAAFSKAATLTRGIVGVVEAAGEIRAGDEVRVDLYETPAWLLRDE